MKRMLAVCLILLSSTLAGADKTPYKFMFSGNSYSGPRNVTAYWLAERYDCGIAGLVDWPGMHDSIYDIAKAMGKEYWCGPYASSQEINLYDRLNRSKSYNDRLKDLDNQWLYIYAKRYLDSIGVSPESLVVHVGDSYISMTQDGDGARAYNLTGLRYPQTRFTYQYWNNTSSDTMFYPAGYCWLANGYNKNARQAIAYAFRRRMIEDSVKYGPGDHHWTAVFMDNQYRGAYMPRMSSYYDITSATGGRTSGLDWVEQPGMGVIDSCTKYFDKSTLLIDSTINAVLDSVCRVKKIPRIITFANVEKFSSAHLGRVVDKVNGVLLENPLDWTKSWPSGWAEWYAMADTMAKHPNVYIDWSMHSDFLCSSDPTSWRFDSSRIYMTHYAFYLTVRDTNAFYMPGRFNDSTTWRKIYEVDFGAPDGRAYEISSKGSGYQKIAVMRRDYNRGNVAVLVRTGYDAADYVRDSVPINLHGLFFSIDDRANVSTKADSIFYLKPYVGKILIRRPVNNPIIFGLNATNTVCLIGTTDTLTFTISDDSGLDSLQVRLEGPTQSTVLLAYHFPAGVPIYSARITHTWQESDCGINYLAIYARDQSGNVVYEPAAMQLMVAKETIDIGEAVFLINHLFRQGPAPDPYESGDANCDGLVNLSDALYIVNHVFRHGPPICCPR